MEIKKNKYKKLKELLEFIILILKFIILILKFIFLINLKSATYRV